MKPSKPGVRSNVKNKKLRSRRRSVSSGKKILIGGRSRREKSVSVSRRSSGRVNVSRRSSGRTAGRRHHRTIGQVNLDVVQLCAPSICIYIYTL